MPDCRRITGFDPPETGWTVRQAPCIRLLCPHNRGMNLHDFDTFARQSRAEGFDEVIERRWDPLTVLDTHTHPFDVKAVVTQGRLWLTIDHQTRELQTGDTFSLARDVPHAERYGPEGATYWVARRN